MRPSLVSLAASLICWTVCRALITGLLKAIVKPVCLLFVSVTLRAVFPNPQHVLLPGMFVRARVDEGIMNDAILAPQQGITRDAKGTATALVVNASNKVEQRQLETGDTYGDKWLVLSGLKAGDKLIVEGTDKVTAGQEVKAEEMKAAGGKA